MIRSVRKTLISVFATIMLSSCLCFGIFAAINKNAVSAAPAEITITSLGAHNDNIFILNTTGGDASNAGGKQITVYINDEPNDIWVHEGDASSVTLAIGKSAYRLNDESYLHIRVPAGTRFGDCVLKEDYDFYNLMNVNGGFVYVGQESTTAVAITGLNGVIKDHAGQQRWYISLGASVAEGVDIDGQIWNCNVFYATAADDIKGSYTLYGGTTNVVNVNKESNSVLGLIINYDVVGETSGTTGHKRLYKIPEGTVWGGYHGACRITNSLYLLYDGNSFIYSESDPTEERTISFVGLTNQKDSERYIMTLNGGTGNGEYGSEICDVIVKTDGAEKTAKLWNWGEDLAIYISYDVLPATGYHVFEIEKQALTGGYTLEGVFLAIRDGEVTTPITFDEVKIVSIEGATQDVDSANLHRYLIYLYFDKAFEYSEFCVGDITVSVNGKDEVVGAYNDADGKCVFLTVDYTIAPKETKNEITIKAGTKFANYVVTEELTVKTKGTAVEIKTDLVDMEIEWKKDLLGYLEGGTQDNLGRYVFYIQTNLENIGDTMWNGNECVIDAGTENERYAPIYYFGGIAKPDSEDYDGTAILVILNYNDIEEGARNAAEIAMHSVTIKKGSELGGGYLIANDLTLWLRGEDFAENEDELPEPPDGVFSLSRGIENKSIEYTAQNIEDYIAGASVVKLKAGAKKLVDNNVFFAACDPSLLCKSIKIIGKKSEPQIKFRSVYSGGDVYLALEIRSESDNGNHWIEQGAPIVRLRYCGSKAAETDVSECLWFDFFTDGLQNSPLIASFTNDEFRLDEGEFFVEFGAVNKTDSYGKEGFVFFVNVIQGEKQAYAECLMTGENNVSEAGDVAIYQGPFNTARIDVDYVKWTEKDVKDFTLMSVDSERTIDGETVKIGAMSFYSPQIRREENYDKYDISDIIPIGNGKTYTKVEGDVTSASQSMINATNVSAGNGGYSVKMKITFTGDDFGCTFAFRGKNTHAASGYVIHIAEDQVIVGSIAKASPFKTGETYEIEVGCVDYFVAEEKVSSGAFVFLKVNGELVIEDSIDKKAGLGTYFCGLIEGAGGSTVTIAAVNDSAKQPVITTKSNKTVVANGKKTTLSYESDMLTAFDEVTYEVVKGKARIEGDGLFSESDGEIVVRAKITNEFGTFYGSEITLNAGAKDGGGCSCGASLDGAIFALPLIAAAAIAIIFKKRREN